MSKTDITRNKIKSKIEAIKNINNDPNILIDNVFDKYNDDLPDIGSFMQKRLTNITAKTKGKTQNKKDIFDELIKTCEIFLGADKEEKTNLKEKPLVASKLKRHAKNATINTLKTVPQIITDEIRTAFFSGDGICGNNNIMTKSSITIKPKEFDFLNVLNVSPTSITGQIIYEPNTPTNFIKFNQVLYNLFDNNNTYNFQTSKGSLFTINWDTNNQEYVLNGLKGSLNQRQISDFLTYYYSSIEYPDVKQVIKNSMYLILNGDGTEPKTFKISINNMNRLLKKLFSLCGNSPNDNPLKSDSINQFNEDEDDVQNYFNFDDVEGIDLEDENDRLNNYLRFKDCGNFTVPVSPNHIEDFVYFNDQKDIETNTNETLDKAAYDVKEQTNIDFFTIRLSLTKSFISQIPKAIISSILTPKIFLPIVVIYKMIYNSFIEIKELMKNMANLFYNIIKKIFWKFITEFWSLVKKEILNFIKKIAIKILKNKIKRYKSIVTALIALLLKIINSGNIQSCDQIFGLILQTIQSAINTNVKIPIPGILLVLSDTLPGFSTDRAYMNINERLVAMGVNMNPIYGQDNKLNTVIKGIIDGLMEEIDTNSYIKIALKPTTIPAGPGGAVITPLVTGVGKLF